MWGLPQVSGGEHQRASLASFDQHSLSGDTKPLFVNVLHGFCSQHSEG
jgi:hypothetical protein